MNHVIAIACGIAAGLVTWLALMVLPYIIIALVAILAGVAVHRMGIDGVAAHIGSFAAIVRSSFTSGEAA